MDASAPDERKTPVTGVLIFVGRAERPGVRHQDRCATVCAQTSAGKALPARSATVTDRAATRLSRRAVAAGKQRRGRAARPPHPCRRCGLPLHYFDPVSILPEFCTWSRKFGFGKPKYIFQRIPRRGVDKPLEATHGLRPELVFQDSGGVPSVIWRRIHTYYMVIKHVLRVGFHVIRAHDTLRAT